MSRKKCHRRTVDPSAHWNAIINSQPTRPAEVSRIMVMVRLAYEKLKAGHGGDHDYDRLGAAMNVGMIRAEAIDPSLVEMFTAAGRAMLEAERIRRRHGHFGFHGEDLLAVNAGLELYEQILSLSSPNQMHAAAEEAVSRIRRGEVERA